MDPILLILVDVLSYGLYSCSYGDWGCERAWDIHNDVRSGKDCGCAVVAIDGSCTNDETPVFGALHSAGVGMGSYSCQKSDGSQYTPNVGSGYTPVYKGGSKKLYVKKHTGELESYGYKCSFSNRYSCGWSNNPQPCPIYHSGHTCSGSPNCIQMEERTVIRNGQSVQENVCVAWEHPYKLYCVAHYIGGYCTTPSGGCSPRGRGNSDKTKEKATKRSVCSSHCNSSTHCCSGDSSTNSNCP